jgi:hypothetical protein
MLTEEGAMFKTVAILLAGLVFALGSLAAESMATSAFAAEIKVFALQSPEDCHAGVQRDRSRRQSLSGAPAIVVEFSESCQRKVEIPLSTMSAGDHF